MINSKELITAIKQVSKLTSQRQTMPILNYIKLSWSNDSAIIEATDLSNYAYLKIGKVESWDNACFDLACVEPKILIEAIGNSEEISFTRNEAELSLSNGSELPCILASEWPANPCYGSSGAISITLPNKHTLDSLLVVSSKDESRYNLCGACFNLETLEVASTDGHRLYIAPLSGKSNKVGQRLVSNLTLKLMVNLIEQSTGELIFSTDLPGTVTMPLSNGYLSARLIDGQFPDYRQAIKTGKNTILGINPKALGKTLAPMAKRVKKPGIVPATLTLSDHDLIIEQSLPDKGTMKAQSNGIKVSKPITLGICPKYLHDALFTMQGEVTARYRDDLGPIELSDTHNNKHIVMPMRLK